MNGLCRIQVSLMDNRILHSFVRSYGRWIKWIKSLPTPSLCNLTHWPFVQVGARDLRRGKGKSPTKRLINTSTNIDKFPKDEWTRPSGNGTFTFDELVNERLPSSVLIRQTDPPTNYRHRYNKKIFISFINFHLYLLLPACKTHFKKIPEEFHFH